MRHDPLSLTEPGRFVLGCNYWASHAGTAMWRDWRPDEVDRDVRRLAAAGLQVLRVFPTWDDFQPLTAIYAGGYVPEMRHGEQALADDEAGRAGLDATMLDRFTQFLSIADRHGLKLIVGLLTGWMSGRLFLPPALAGRNAIVDPLCLQWELRFVRHFVTRFKPSPAILAWDLGNECNCMSGREVTRREQAWVWTAAVVDAIRACDGSRPVVSGMHSLLAPGDPWTVRDQGELTDVLTTHPYPIFTPHCNLDPLDTMRPMLHATAESRAYADLGGKPCLAEELGTLGSAFCSEVIGAAYLRTNLFSLWANDCHGLLWWCAFDQGHLQHAPYDWHGMERELGLLRADRTAKPMLDEFTAFRQFLDGLPFGALPPAKREAVCLATEGADPWALAYGAFVLAKQAGFDIAFQQSDQPLRDAPLYLMPSVSGLKIISRRRWLALLDRVRGGATLYISLKDGFLQPFNEPLGIEVQTRTAYEETRTIALTGLRGRPRFTARFPVRMNLRTTTATTLGRDTEGQPVFTVAPYGKGRIFFLAFPLETQLTTTPGAFHGPSAQPFWRIYRHLAEGLGDRVAAKDLPEVGITEHDLDEHRRAIVMINYSARRVRPRLTLAPGWRLAEVLRGAVPRAALCPIPPHDAWVAVLAPARRQRGSRA